MVSLFTPKCEICGTRRATEYFHVGRWSHYAHRHCIDKVIKNPREYDDIIMWLVDGWVNRQREEKEEREKRIDNIESYKE